MKRYYIASRLENVNQVREVKTRLDAAGWEHTYDWTVHGSVQKCTHDVIADVAAKEMLGVINADVVIVLLKGGRGTHVEIGGAIVNAMRCPSNRICIFSPDPERDFGTTGDTCAFYHHPLVERYASIDSMLDALVNK